MNSLYLIDISIHAPERGATTTCLIKYVIYKNFNPRPRAGSDDDLIRNRFGG